MARQDDDGLRRRDLLGLLGVAGAAALVEAPVRVAFGADAEAPSAVAQTAPAARTAGPPYGRLYDLVMPMTDPNDPKPRIAFDDHSADKLLAANLNAINWQAIVSMNQNDSVKFAVESELPAGSDELKNWPNHFEDFKTKWMECEPGYTPPPDDCEDCRAASECDKKAHGHGGDVQILYSGPSPHLGKISKKDRTICGEGFVRGAAVEFWEHGADPDQVHDLSKLAERLEEGVTVSGTFRCSMLTFPKPTKLKFGKRYDVYVVNRQETSSGVYNGAYFRITPPLSY